MRGQDALTPRALIAEARSILLGGGYEVSTYPAIVESLGDLCFVGEDAFGVVLITAYETWTSLSDGWRDAQSALVRLLTEKLSRGNPKSWEGYLVLLTPSLSGDERAEDDIRYDTSRVRKIVGTGESIRFIDDLTDVLMALLPLTTSEIEESDGSASVLDRLAEMLIGRDIAPAIAAAVVNAFKTDEPLLESISASVRK